MTETTPALTPDEAATLAAVLDCLIPASPERGLPSAGALGLADYVAGRFGPALALLRSGLRALEQAACERGGVRFAERPRGEREALLRARAEADAGFLPPLLFHGYAGYYASAAVLAALGMEGRPPHPLGYALEPFDEGLVERVRGSGRLWREA